MFYCTYLYLLDPRFLAYARPQDDNVFSLVIPDETTPLFVIPEFYFERREK